MAYFFLTESVDYDNRPLALAAAGSATLGTFGRIRTEPAMTDTTTDYHGYSVRRLNPFRGVVQIAQSSRSRAISTDGETWDLQIKTRKPDDMWGADSPAGSTLQYLRFGTWSRRAGLSKVPAHPLLDMTSMLDEARRLTRFLEAADPTLPFPLSDRFELWLLDGSDRNPLALIASSTESNHLPEERPYRWQCADPADADFPAPEWDRIHPRHPRDTAPTPHIDALNRLVSLESGHALAQWFERLPSGAGAALPIPDMDRLNNRLLPADCFPELLIREHWRDRHDADLVADYIGWLSPLLLTLRQISDDRRVTLESQARRRAVKVEESWRFYPKIIDKGAIEAARVEARLVEANG